jgi:hypothetical protein
MWLALVLLAAWSEIIGSCSYFEFRHGVDIIICHHSGQDHCAPSAPAAPDFDRGQSDSSGWPGATTYVSVING